ncbi:trans-sialidase, putative [Trypanosoma cruzi]|uniref:Trans-sialidase, putative n=2 Tax=Trypanosoma cruzi TaxID=5693 RepID=Q4D6K2_TRYCC|nr:trans-sialidase, putative [Trypanosoma cruzi]EAN88154.1 trans-sialidase, putative [Trypanosoma cruzi]|eukprot:XP_810005.1 trans-sialidase [Trypanosoma cruzi strain CL Brener]
MLSRVAAVKAPRTHNRRRVTGSSGRRREGRESEPRRPNMSRRVFASAVLLLLVVLICCGTCGAAATEKPNSGKNDLINIQNLQRVDLFVPQTTLVLPKMGTDSGRRDSFVSPSLVSAGGVIAAFAEGHMNAKTPPTESTKPSSDVVAEYIDSAWEWSTLVEKVSESTWKAHTVLGTTDGTDNRVGVVLRPTTTMKDNKVFLLAGSTDAHKEGLEWKVDNQDLKLVVGDVTPSTRGEPGGRIEWGDPRPLFDSKYSLNHKNRLNTFFPSGGAGVLMENGTLVFSLMAKSEENDGVYSMIIYSTNNGSTWSLSEGVSSAGCRYPRITEWEGSLLMIVDCNDEQKVYESRDMGTTWTEAIGTLPGVWVNSRSRVSQDVSLRVDALITATIEGRKVMLYTQRGYFSGGNKATALYLWVTDNNRTFSVGPVAVEDNMNWMLASTLLYSDGRLHLLQQRDNDKGGVISLSRLTEEVSTIRSVLSTWAQKDIFFSNLSIPTAGLVAVLSDAAGDGRWYDEYLCLNATVTNATKVKDGFQLTEPDSGVIWPVNTQDDNVRHVFLSHYFTLVASVTIEEAPTADAPLLTAVLRDAGPPYLMRLSYTADNKWETIVEGKMTKPTTESRLWVPKEEYQVALMLQGNKASVYIDGESLGEEEALSTDERPIDVAGFCFGACEMHNSPVTVKNVFLYNRPLNSTEMTAIKDRIPVPKRAPESQADDVPQTVASAGSAAPGPREVPAAPGRTTMERATTTEHAAAVSFTSAGSGLLPLLLLLGLWVFAAL